eukprot:snap_masked-scaffold_6-processed-gene-18.12-mRNA-1 protein AED:1.00 eAED:1.00 QI:0/0/0/0/1/1/3/0/353
MKIQRYLILVVALLSGYMLNSDVIVLPLFGLNPVRWIRRGSQDALRSIIHVKQTAKAQTKREKIYDEDLFDGWEDISVDKECHKFEPKAPIKLEKTASASTKFVFVMGLEGSGHHLIRPLFSSCKVCYCPRHSPAFSLGRNRMLGGLFGANVTRKALTKQMKGLMSELRKQRLYQNKTFFINAYCSSWGTGELSYPNYIHTCREYKYPNPHLLASLFENQHLDFRILFLKRDLFDILLSTTIHRRFQTWDEGIEIYSKMVKILSKQVSLLSQEFFTCLDYDTLPEVNSGIGNFLGTDRKGFSIVKSVEQNFRHSSRKWLNDSRFNTLFSKKQEPRFISLNQALTTLYTTLCNI